MGLTGRGGEMRFKSDIVCVALQKFRNQRWPIALISILALALLLRLYGITWGFPYIYHPDERYLVQSAYHFGTGDLNPGWFGYPALQMYILFFVNILFTGVGFMSGRFSSLEDVSALWISQHHQFYLLGRLTTVVFGIGTVVLAYFLGKAFFREKKIGLLAALFLSVVPLHVEHSHYATTDVPMTFWITATCLAAYQAYMTGQRKYYVIASLTSGLAAATKYTVGLVIVTLVIAHLLRVETGRRSLLRRLLSGELILSSACAAAAFLIANPFLLLNYEQALNDLEFDYLHARWGSLTSPPGSSWCWYLSDALPAGLSLPLMLSSLSGLIYMLARRSKEAYILAIFPTLYLLFIGRWTVHWDRWLVPVAPFLLLFAAKLLFDLAVKLQQSFPHATVAFTLIVIVLTLVPLSTSLLFDHRLTLPDTRTISKAWVEANIPVGSKILMDGTGGGYGYCPPLSRDQYEQKAIPGPKRKVQGYEMPHENLEIDYYRREGFEYVIVSSWIYERYYQETAELRCPAIADAYQAFYDGLGVSASLLQVFEPQDGKIEGPTIKIYQLK